MKKILEKYKNHPRILELRLAGLHSLFSQEFGSEKTTQFFKAVCDLARINWTLISSVINRKDLVYTLATRDLVRYRQEVVFMGLCFGETRPSVASRYLGLSRRIVYESKDGYLNPANYLTEDWLSGLDYTVAIAGVDAYRLEIERFLESLDELGGLVRNVPLAKIRL